MNYSTLRRWRRYTRGWIWEMIRRLKVATRLRGIDRRNPILVYQMGKVGSNTVMCTLRALGLDRPIVQVHTLDPDHLARAVARQRASRTPFLPAHLLVSRGLVRRLSRRRFPCQVITLTREPIARAISFVFEDWKKKAPDAWQPHAPGELDPAVMQEAVTALLRQNNGVADPTHWFDTELRGVLGVDVFAEPFDDAQGFAILPGETSGPPPTLVLRVEDLNRALVLALARFLELDPDRVELAPANVGAAKWYAEALGTVKAHYLLPSDVADRVLNTRYVRHFYAEEQARLRERWAASEQPTDERHSPSA